MNEQPYNKDHLENYMGILTSKLRNGTFKMELKAEDNPVLERLIEKNESSIELEFRCDLRTTTAFYHNIVSCPLRNSKMNTAVIAKILRQYTTNLKHAFIT